MSCLANFATLPASLPLVLGSVVEIETVDSDYSLEAGLVRYLKALHDFECVAAGRVFPYYVPRDVEAAADPCITYEVHEVPNEAVTGQSGSATATIDLTCWAPTFGDSVKVAAVVRRLLQGFSGNWGPIGVIGCWYQGFDDECQEPQDDSTTYWHGRTLTFDVTYSVPLHTF